MTQSKVTIQRIAQARVNLEPMLQHAVEKAAIEDGLTLSSYIRNLLLREMVRRGKITSDDLLTLAS